MTKFILTLLLIGTLFGDTIKLVINDEDKPDRYTNLFKEKLIVQEISISGRYLGVYNNFIFIQTVDKIERYECEYVIEIESDSGVSIPFDCSQNNESLEVLYYRNPNIKYTLLLMGLVVALGIVVITKNTLEELIFWM